MATVEELVPIKNSLQGQQHALNRKIEVGSSKSAVQAGCLARAGGDCDCSPTTKFGRHQRSWFKGESVRFTEWLRKTTGFRLLLLAQFSCQ